MPRQNKIIKYNLENEVLELAGNPSLSQDKIAEQIRYRHSDIKELQNLSAMSINRYLKSKAVSNASRELEEGKNPEDSLRAEFRERMYDLDDETHNLLQEAKLILKNSRNNENSDIQLKAVREVGRTIDQIRKNWYTFIEQGYRQFKPIVEAKEVNFININNLLIEMSKNLCPSCRKKVIDLATLKEEA